jgi:aerobic carbon-monoxide dehydrogenase medium subunit
VTLPAFQLHRPGTVEEASALLDEYGDDAALYCGGSELILLMKLGFADYGHVIDIKGIEELRDLRREGDAYLHIGAAVTHRRLERSPLVRENWTALASMERNVANIRVRTVGSLGGNLCFADPHSDPATFLLAAGAELACRRGAAERLVPMADFILGPYQTALRRGELLTHVRVPALPSGAVIVHKKLAFRERPAATVACMLPIENDLVAHSCRVSVGSVGAVPVRALEAEAMLIGLSLDAPDSSIVKLAGEAAAEASNAIADLNGSPDYKRNLVRVLVKRCIDEARQTQWVPAAATHGGSSAETVDTF